MIFSVPNVSIGKIQILFGYQTSPPLKLHINYVYALDTYKEVIYFPTYINDQLFIS
jgi:hypothetical protein